MWCAITGFPLAMTSLLLYCCALRAESAAVIPLATKDFSGSLMDIQEMKPSLDTANEDNKKGPVKYAVASVRNKRNFEYLDYYGGSSEEGNNFGYDYKPTFYNGWGGQRWKQQPTVQSGYGFWHVQPHYNHHHTKNCKHPYHQHHNHHHGGSEYEDNYSEEKFWQNGDKTSKKPSTTPSRPQIPFTTSSATTTTTEPPNTTEYIPNIDIRSAN